MNCAGCGRDHYRRRLSQFLAGKALRVPPDIGDILAPPDRTPDAWRGARFGGSSRRAVARKPASAVEGQAHISGPSPVRRELPDQPRWRLTMTVWGEAVDIGIFRQKPVQHRAQQDDAAALEGGFPRQRSAVSSSLRAGKNPSGRRIERVTGRTTSPVSLAICASVTLSEASANSVRISRRLVAPSRAEPVVQPEMVQRQV